VPDAAGRLIPNRKETYIEHWGLWRKFELGPAMPRFLAEELLLAARRAEEEACAPALEVG
jgi:hypothetical protein